MNSLPTINNWLRASTQQLELHNVSTARLDCLVLLEDILGKDRTQLLAHDEQIISTEQLDILNAHLKRRLQHEPLAYIRGKSEFYGRDFIVSKDTLEPRPETETMIKLVNELTPVKQVADVGAGTGAIGITLALELSTSTIDMYELSPAAVKIAKQNIQKHDTQNCHIYKNDLLGGVTKQYDIVVANLPYVPTEHAINQAATYEPKLAIFGGLDGLDLYRRLFEQLNNLSPYVVTESLPSQHKQLAQIAKKAGYTSRKSEDFIQIFSKD